MVKRQRYEYRHVERKQSVQHIDSPGYAVAMWHEYEIAYILRAAYVVYFAEVIDRQGYCWRRCRGRHIDKSHDVETHGAVHCPQFTLKRYRLIRCTDYQCVEYPLPVVDLARCHACYDGPYRIDETEQAGKEYGHCLVGDEPFREVVDQRYKKYCQSAEQSASGCSDDLLKPGFEKYTVVEP